MSLTTFTHSSLSQYRRSVFILNTAELWLFPCKSRLYRCIEYSMIHMHSFTAHTVRVEMAERIHLYLYYWQIAVHHSSSPPPSTIGWGESTLGVGSLICWTDCWGIAAIIDLSFIFLYLPALMQLDTRSRLFEFLAHGLVSWKWEVCIGLF